MKMAILVKTILCAALCLSGIVFSAYAQSGRIKTTESPTPTPTPHRVYFPNDDARIVSKNPKPTPTPASDEDDGGVIRVQSALVPIPVSVLNSAGQAVTNLKLEDFELLIDGNKAEISDIARSETPVRLALLFDNSSSVTIAREFEKKAAIKFFRRVIRPEKDLAAIFSVSTISQLEQPLTKDVSQLVQAIEGFAIPSGATALLDGIIKGANYLKDAGGRRVIVIVSDGDDTISDSTLEDTLKALQLGNCQVYVVKTTDFENYKRTGQRGGNANIRYLAAERRMQEITAQTGGAVYSPLDEDELDRAFAQISAELSQQYILSYYPEDESDKQGELRTISLTVRAREKLFVRTRKSYYVPRRVIGR
jgi:Ca-activated chloride channel family protein